MSPAIHQAAYDAFGLPHSYQLCDCPAASDVERQVGALRAGEWAGLNVTVPWKRLALKLADDVDSSARETGAANVLVRQPSGRIMAHNTDAPALARLLASKMVADAPAAALVLGNGGAALAAVVAARRAGALRIFVSARRWTEPRNLWEAASEFEALGAEPIAWKHEVWASQASGLGLLVQATSAGMTGVGGGEDLAATVPWRELPPSAFAYDVVYNPQVTPFLQRASDHGLRSEGGLTMLVGQAAFAIELWLGMPPPQQLLLERARQAIFGHEASKA